MNLEASTDNLLTTMPQPHLPPEIVDYIIDFLHDKPETLKQCCLASKSLVPRAQRHIFKNIQIGSLDKLEAWKRIFPDAKNSPARHALSLVILCAELVVAEDAKEGGWISSFTNVERLELWNSFSSEFEPSPLNSSLAPFQILSASVKSLRVFFEPLQPSKALEFICSFPLLEDLGITSGPQVTECIDSITCPAGRPSLSGNFVGYALP